MPKAQLQNPTRTYKTRTTGIFKKAAFLHEFDESIRIAIVIEKPRSVPLVFTLEEDGISWPLLMREYVSPLLSCMVLSLTTYRRISAA
jgi:hypothetical protein